MSVCYAVGLRLTPDNIPCAFPALEEFSFKYDGDPITHIHGHHTADLCALLETAPLALRSVRLHGGTPVALAYKTMQWLMAHRPGAFRTEGTEEDLILELTPPSY
jgi:hypothetical protein